jgi:hypothetical protein
MVQWGINLNPEHPVGQPADPNALRGVKWVRMVFKVGAAGRTLDQALGHYDGIVNTYNGIGAKVLFVLNQETVWGNAPWDNGDWGTYALNFAAECGRIAAHYKGRGVAYEIWNEGDLRGESSAFVSAPDYAKVLTAASAAIKAQDAAAPVIVGGLAGGNEPGYLGEVQAILGRLPVDGIGFHPYAHYPPNFLAKPDWGGWFGELAPKLAGMVTRFPGIPIWITEIGVSEHIPYPPEQYPMVMQYMEGIQSLVMARFAGSIPIVIWFAWSDGMRNAGIVDGNNQPKDRIYAKFFALVAAANAAGDAPPPADPKLTQPMRVITRNTLRIRREPRRIQGTLLLDQFYSFGQTVMVDPDSRTLADEFVWYRHALGWSAVARIDGTEYLMLPVDASGNVIEPPPPPAPPVDVPPVVVVAPPVDVPPVVVVAPPNTERPAKPTMLKFRVTALTVNIRTAPRTGNDTLSGKRLVRGDIVEVDQASRTEANGFIWWQHKLGWSSSRAMDGSLILMEQVDTRMERSARLLEVPWASQVDVFSPGAFDCGQSCVLMLLKYYNHAAPGLVVKNLTDVVDGRTTMSQLIALAAGFGLTLTSLPIAPTLNALQTGLSKQIDAGKPVILLVNYRQLGFDNIVASKSDPGLHWLIVVGAEGDTFYVHDPLWMPIDRQGRGGAFVPIRIDSLVRAYRSVALG